MNFEKLKSSVNTLIRFKPLSKSRDAGGEIRDVDDEWRLEEVDRNNGVKLKNLRTDHYLVLNEDHIHHFTTGQKQPDNIKRGFFELTVGIELNGDEVKVTPLLSGRARITEGLSTKTRSKKRKPSYITERQFALRVEFADTRTRARNGLNNLWDGISFWSPLQNTIETASSAVDDLRRISEQIAVVEPKLYQSTLTQCDLLDAVVNNHDEFHFWDLLKAADDHYQKLRELLKASG